MPAVLNYSNELMVESFLNNEISFNEITINNEKIMSKFLIDGCNVETPGIKDLNNAFSIINSYIKPNNSIIDQFNRWYKEYYYI